MTVVAMTLRTDEELDTALEALSTHEGISKQEVVRRAVLERAERSSLRAEVDATLRKVEQLVGDLERRWPFKREPELKLP